MRMTLLVALMSIAIPTLDAQAPAHDPSGRLAELLSPEVAEGVLARIAEARARELPAQALEHRALELAVKGASGAEVERRVAALAGAMERARNGIASGRGGTATPDEISAGGEAIVRGVDGEAVSQLAASAPSGRSLAVPLHVLSSLMSRGLPADEAVARVHQRLLDRSTDQMMQDEASSVVVQEAPGRPTLTGRALAETLRPAPAGPPATLPASAGGSSRGPRTPPGGRPPTP